MRSILKNGLLAAVLCTAVNAPQLCAQTKYGSPSKIGANYTQLLAFNNPSNQNCYLGYSTSGNWEIGTIQNSQLTATIPNGVGAPTGWTSMSTFNVGNNLFYTQYDPSKGHLQINQMANDCHSISTVVDSYVQAGLSQVVALTYNNNITSLMAYHSGGVLEFYSITLNSAGIPSSVDLFSAYPIAPGYTTFMPYSLNGLPCFVAYNPNGSVEFDEIGAFGPQAVFAGSWGPGWAGLVPELTTPYFLRYGPTLGSPPALANILEITGDTNTQYYQVLTFNNGGLGTNYTLFASFYVMAVDSAQPIPRFMSYRADGQVQMWYFPF
jgi:hypothetical protein